MSSKNTWPDSWANVKKSAWSKCSIIFLSSLIMDVIQLTTSAPLSWKYGFPCEPLTPFNISCIVIVDRGPAPNLSRSVREGSLCSLFLFSLTTYKCIQRTHSLIPKRMLKNQLSRWIQWCSYQHSSWMSYHKPLQHPYLENTDYPVSRWHLSTYLI